MKQISLLVLSFIFCFCVPAQSAEPAPRALFVSVVQNPSVFSSRDEITNLIDFAKQARIKILFVQVYRANQAWFPSQVADSTPYEKALKAVGRDPLALIIKKAHQEGMEVHAWLNLMSLAKNADAPILKKYGTEVLTRNLIEKNKLEDFKIDEQYFLEPGDPRVKNDLTKIVEEVVTAYPNLDGIQFDYIRYPDSQPHYGYTKVNVERFKKASGLKNIDEESLVWKKWKRDQVTELLTGLIKTARARRPNIQVSTTGCMPYARAYYEAYQDWPGWLSSGLVNFVTIMDYSPQPAEFERWIVALKDKVTDFSKMKVSVGAYKFVKTPDIFEQEFRRCEKMGQSCAIFHYGSLQENPALKTFLMIKKVPLP